MLSLRREDETLRDRYTHRLFGWLWEWWREVVGSRTRFDDTCEIVGVKNEIAVTGEILQFREHDIIIATIHRSAKVTLHWQENVDQYVGSMSGVEFRSEGPKSHTYRTTRHRWWCVTNQNTDARLNKKWLVMTWLFHTKLIQTL